jgi:light-regulated signal transduction histidine kinase (bacteriophytochrome)
MISGAMTMNFQTVDLTNCDREPIHTPGSIQPHGAMLVCDPAGGHVAFASANAAAFVGRGGAGLIGLTLDDVIGESAAHGLRNAAAKAGGSGVSGALMACSLPNAPYPIDITIHHHNDLLIVELERAADAGDARAALELTQSLIRRIGLETDVEKIAKSAVKLIRAMLAYDRVMIYRFLHNGAGQVIAEATRAGMQSFIGQHFPASDIPVQARRLYLLNTIRMIGDVGYTPVPLLPFIPEGAPPVDLSYAHLRSVSPIHCEYLRNMGVGASLSISIVVDAQLWGLIACHHDSPKTLSAPLRIGAELFGQYFSLQIGLAERRTAFVAAGLARERLAAIVSGLSADEPVEDALRDRLGALAELIPCDGVGLWLSGAWLATGAAPNFNRVTALIERLNRVAGGNIWHTQDLCAEMGPGAGYGEAVAGALAVPVSSFPPGYLILFRGEEARSVEWAGEPAKTIVSGLLGDRLTPRGSFETWREEVRGQSRPWTDADGVIAEAIRTYLRDLILRHSEATAEQRAHTDHRRRVLNDELNHRVKNIIAVVKSIAQQTGATAATVREYSASLEGRLSALAFAHDQSLDAGGGNLAVLLEAEAGPHREGVDPDRVSIEGPPVGLDDRAFGSIALLVHEMVTNAAKYGALSVPKGRLSVTWAKEANGDCRIVWQERGGPRVRKPERLGFGSKLIQSAVDYDLGGTAIIEYRPAGLYGVFVIPAMHLKESGATVTPFEPHTPDLQILKGCDVLLVEDQALIAMDSEDVLRQLGADSVRAISNAADALSALGKITPHCAVLDFNLSGETSAAIADHLAARRIPFVFVTGYGDSVMIPARFAEVPMVRKPVSGPMLAQKLREILPKK